MTPEQPTRRWCTTTPAGDRQPHDTLTEALRRAEDVVAIGRAPRATVWYRDADDLTGWHTYTVVDMPRLRGVA